MFKTTNSGTLWSEAFEMGTTVLYSVHFPVDGMTGYTVGENGEIYKTTDGGTVWIMHLCPPRILAESHDAPKTGDS